jgi:hypothetical protein
MSLPPPIDKNSLDVAKIFSTYVLFLGDADKTAAALDIEAHVIKSLATCEDWPKKVKQWNELSSGDMREVQIAVNRGVNFVQATRLRSVLDKLVTKLHGLSPDELIETLTVQTKFGSEVKTRALTDLTKACESVQAMTARALGDFPDERPKSESGGKGSSIMLQVAAAMAAADEVGLDSAAVIRKQIAEENKPREEQ